MTSYMTIDLILLKILLNLCTFWTFSTKRRKAGPIGPIRSTSPQRAMAGWRPPTRKQDDLHCDDPASQQLSWSVPKFVWHRKRLSQVFANHTVLPFTHCNAFYVILCLTLAAKARREIHSCIAPCEVVGQEWRPAQVVCSARTSLSNTRIFGCSVHLDLVLFSAPFRPKVIEGAVSEDMPIQDPKFWFVAANLTAVNLVGFSESLCIFHEHSSTRLDRCCNIFLPKLLRRAQKLFQSDTFDTFLRLRVWLAPCEAELSKGSPELTVDQCPGVGRCSYTKT